MNAAIKLNFITFIRREHKTHCITALLHNFENINVNITRFSLNMKSNIRVIEIDSNRIRTKLAYRGTNE